MLKHFTISFEPAVVARVAAAAIATLSFGLPTADALAGSKCTTKPLIATDAEVQEEVDCVKDLMKSIRGQDTFANDCSEYVSIRSKIGALKTKAENVYEKAMDDDQKLMKKEDKNTNIFKEGDIQRERYDSLKKAYDKLSAHYSDIKKLLEETGKVETHTQSGAGRSGMEYSVSSKGPLPCTPDSSGSTATRANTPPTGNKIEPGTLEKACEDYDTVTRKFCEKQKYECVLWKEVK